MSRKSFGLCLSALADDLEVQLQKQGLTLGDQAQLLQRHADAITLLRIHEVITGAESDRARERLFKRIRRTVQPLTKPGTTTED